MYIKQIVIENFKSYSGHHVIRDLDPRNNAIVGSNGSGKSSLLDAISFVLTTKYSPLKERIREQLIANSSQGTRESSRTATVEIILNNEDKKLLHESSEISIKRAIDNDKKDRITVNKRVYTQAELQEFLQSAFPPNNPYYVVEQNQIARLALASDEKRFDILVITAGIDEVFENLDKLLKDVQVKQNELIEKRDNMAEYYEGLKEEGDKFKEWDKIDKLKRFLQEKLLIKMQEEAEEKLEEIRASILEEEERLELLNANYEEKDAEFKNMKKDKGDATERFELLEERINALQADRLKLRTDIQNLTIEKQNLIAKINEHQEVDKDQRAEVNEQIREGESNGRKIEEELREIEKSLIEKQKELGKINGDKRVLIDRNSLIERSRQGTIDAEEIEMDLLNLKNVIYSQEKCMSSQEKIVDDLEKIQEEKEQNLLKMRKRLEELQEEVKKNRKTQESMNERKSKLLNEKKVIQKERYKKQQEIDQTKAELANTDCKFRKLVRREDLQGMDSMEKIIKTWTDEGRLEDVEGIKGALVDNFTCEKTIQYVAELKAGNRLFHYIVRDRHIASKVVVEMKKQKLPGLISCIPVADISVENVPIPTRNDCCSLFSKLTTSSKEAKKVVKSVFGRTIIPKDLETGSRLIQQYPSCHFITLEGDQILKPGIYKGGCNDRSLSRMDLYKKRRELRRKLDEAEAEVQDLNEEIRKNEAETNKQTSEIQKNVVDIDKDKREIEQLDKEIKIENRALRKLKEEYEENQRNLANFRYKLQSERRIVNLRETIEDLESFDVSRIDETIKELRARSIAIDESIEQDCTRLSELRSNLEINERKMNRLREIEQDFRDKEGESSLEQLQSALKLINAQIRTHEETLESVNKNLANLQPQILELQGTLNQLEMSCSKLKLSRKEARLDLQECANCLEDLKEKSRETQFEIVGCQNEIANLGPTPHIENHTSYANLSKKALGTRIQRLKKQEEKLGPINRNVAEANQSLENYLEKLNNLINRAEKANDDCLAMMAHVRRVKLETLEFCFNRTNEYCQDIFKEIVPGGTARLEPIWKDKDEANDEDDVIPWKKVRGISVKATFSEEEPMKNFLSFSGGQKTVLALVFIFALQKLKPAPFYLFDEIDRVLDEGYRQSIAQVIQEMSETSQFFTITFRKELLRNEGQFFKVETQRGVSRITSCTREEAEVVVTPEN